MPSLPPPCNPCNPQLAPAPGPDSDERAFEAFLLDQDSLDMAAATWVTRQRSGLDAQGNAELQAWLDADPRHAEAFADMNTTYGDLQELPSEEVARLKSCLPERVRTETSPPTRAITPRIRKCSSRSEGIVTWLLRSLSAVSPQAAPMVLAIVVAGTGWLGWDFWRRQPVFEQTYATTRGQQLTAILPDAEGMANAKGSTLQLDTLTRAHVQLYRDRREVRLQDGQAMFAVHSDAQRPFHVYAGAVRITVTGTRFSVRHTDTGLDKGQTVVSVEEGSVRVARRQTAEGATSFADTVASDSSAVELTAGHTVLADAQGQLGAIAKLPTGTVAYWRAGRLNFNQTPLADAIAEFERYGSTGLMVRDPVVAALPVGGSFSLGQHQQFVKVLPQLLPVRLVRRGELTEVVALPR